MTAITKAESAYETLIIHHDACAPQWDLQPADLELDCEDVALTLAAEAECFIIDALTSAHPYGVQEAEQAIRLLLIADTKHTETIEQRAAKAQAVGVIVLKAIESYVRRGMVRDIEAYRERVGELNYCQEHY